MKKILYNITLAIVALVVVQSCDDQLEIPPNASLVTEVAFQDVDDLQASLNFVYGGYSTAIINMNSIFTDNTRVGRDSGGQQRPFHDLVMDATNGTASGIWISRYAMINNASRLIEASEIVTVEEGEESRVENILGQAYALRALAHFELFQYFTPDYSNGSGISVPAVDFVVTTQNLPRNTVDEVFQLIDADLSTAADLIDTSLSDNRFVTLDFITALRARMALFRGDYDAAQSFAQSLIDTYPLANQSQYQLMYFDVDNTEVIWKAARVLGDARPGFIWHFAGGGPFLEMSQGFFDAMDPADARFNVNLSADSDVSINLLRIGKYDGTAVEFLADFKVFRVSEMYLIKAEAQLRKAAPDVAGAQQTIELLRDARFGTATGTPDFNNVQTGLDFILDERRIELAYEGHRYLDLKRYGVGLNRADDDCANLQNACTMSASDRRFTLPIPIAELNANPLMEQNPGY